eukprot:19748-Eustigmatos_ZCMA.PRE.1
MGPARRPGASEVQQTRGARQVAGLRAALHVEPAEEAPQVHLDGVLADLQLLGDVAVGQAAVQHDQQ